MKTVNAKKRNNITALKILAVRVLRGKKPATV
jgi:hypothetical protein